MPASTATKTRVAHNVRAEGNLGGRAPSPRTLAAEAVMEAHAFIDRAGAELVTDLHVLSRTLHNCRTRAEVIAQLHKAASHFTDRIVRMKSRLRDLNREIDEIAA